MRMGAGRVESVGVGVSVSVLLRILETDSSELLALELLQAR